MRSKVLDFKNSEYIHIFFKIQDKPDQIAYRLGWSLFSLDVRLKPLVRLEVRAIWHSACVEVHFSKGGSA